MACIAYMDINNKIYKTDKIKIIFTLSFIHEGNMLLWKEDFLRHAQDPMRKDSQGLIIGYRGWVIFQKEFKEAFGLIDPTRTAMAKIRILKMKDNLQEYISDFKTLAHKAGVMEDVTLK